MLTLVDTVARSLSSISSAYFKGCAETWSLSEEQGLPLRLPRFKVWPGKGRSNAMDTYIKIVVHLGSDGIIIGSVIIPKYPSVSTDLEPNQGQRFQNEIVRIPWIDLQLVRKLYAQGLEKGLTTVKL